MFSTLQKLTFILNGAVIEGFGVLFSKSSNKEDLQHKESVQVISAFTVILLITTLISLVLTVIAIPISITLFNVSANSARYIWLLFLFLCLYVTQSEFCTMFESILKIQRKQRIIIIAVIIQSTINILGDYLSLHYEWGITGIYISTTIAETLKLLIYICVLKLKIEKPTLCYIKHQLNICKNLLVNRFLLKTFAYLEKWFASMLGELNFCIYSLALNIIETLEKIARGSCEESHLVYVGEYYSYHSRIEKKCNTFYEVNLFKQTLFYILAQSLVITLMYLILSYPIYVLHTDELAWESIEYLIIIGYISSIVYLAALILSNVLKVYDNIKYISKSTIIGFSIRILLILGFYSLDLYQPIWIIIAMTIDWIIRFIYILFVTYRLPKMISE